jgi:hypothetical protein
MKIIRTFKERVLQLLGGFEAMLDDAIIDTHSLLSNRAASFNDWRFSKKSLQGSARLSRFAKFPMLKSAGISVVLTSDHSQHAIL